MPNFDSEQSPNLDQAFQQLGHAFRHHFVSKEDLREMEDRLTQAIEDASEREDVRLFESVLRHSERITVKLEALAGTAAPK